MKKKKMILILEQNYDQTVGEVLRNPEVEYLALTVFYRTKIEDGLNFLKKLRRIFSIQTIFVISDIEYLANDLEVGAVLELKKFYDFNLENFIEVFETSISHYPDVYGFLASVSDLYHFSFNTYEDENPWFFLFQNHGILVINDRNYHKILQNYHKIKAHTSDLAFINLNEEGTEKNLKLLKMLGSDAHIAFGLTNNLKSSFSQWIDLILHQRSPYYEKNIQQFILHFLSLNPWNVSLEKFQSFVEMEEKSFEADLWEEEEDVLKPAKRFFLRVEEKSFLKLKGSQPTTLLHIAKNKKEIYCLEKDVDFCE